MIKRCLYDISTLCTFQSFSLFPLVRSLLKFSHWVTDGSLKLFWTWFFFLFNVRKFTWNTWVCSCISPCCWCWSQMTWGWSRTRPWTSPWVWSSAEVSGGCWDLLSCSCSCSNSFIGHLIKEFQGERTQTWVWDTGQQNGPASWPCSSGAQTDIYCSSSSGEYKKHYVKYVCL